MSLLKVFCKGTRGSPLFIMISLLFLDLVLDNNQEQVFVWGNHDFLSFTSNSEKGKIVEWINVSDNRSGFFGEFSDFLGVLPWGTIVIA